MLRQWAEPPGGGEGRGSPGSDGEASQGASGNFASLCGQTIWAALFVPQSLGSWGCDLGPCEVSEVCRRLICFLFYLLDYKIFFKIFQLDRKV